MEHLQPFVLADGRVATEQLRVVATADSHHGTYVAGDLGTVVSVSRARGNPVVCWDSTGKEVETNPTKIRPQNIALGDGQAAAVGLRVVATGASSHANRYAVGDTGTIVGLNVGDPVVLWDNSGKEFQTKRDNLKRLPNLVLADGQMPVVGLRVSAVQPSRYGHYHEGDEGTVVRLTDADPIVRWDRTGQEQRTPRTQIRGALHLVLSDGQIAAVGLRVCAVVPSVADDAGVQFEAGDPGIIVRLDGGHELVVVRWDTNHKEAGVRLDSIRSAADIIIADGVTAVAGLRVVALEPSTFGNYAPGDVGEVVRLAASDPVVKWERSGEEHTASRNKLRAAHHFHLVDGQTAAVGLRVVATAGDDDKHHHHHHHHHHHSAGDEGTIVRLSSSDPVVKWDRSGEEHVTRHTQLKGVPPKLPSVQQDSPGADDGDEHALPSSSRHAGTRGDGGGGGGGGGGGASNPPASDPASPFFSLLSSSSPAVQAVVGNVQVVGAEPAAREWERQQQTLAHKKAKKRAAQRRKEHEAAAAASGEAANSDGEAGALVALPRSSPSAGEELAREQ